MRFSLSWLRRHLETTASLTELGDTLTSLGLEVEKIYQPSHSLKNFEIAEVVDVTSHPNAEKLQVCKVRTGQGVLLQVVCGASNVRVGLRVVLAPVGTWIPGTGQIIKTTRIRDIESQGMLCSASELGIEEQEAQGILEISSEIPVGTSYQDLIDPILDIEVTPNRGDCFSVRGIARDLAAAKIGCLRELSIPEVQPVKMPWVVVEKSSNACTYFSGRIIRSIQNKASPAWLVRALHQAGIRSVSPVVDITNFVLMDIGQPMHAYDRDKIVGDVRVRQADSGEKILALNGLTYCLQPEDVLIADREGPIALAGIMGGERTACTEQTTTVFLESAIFDQQSVARLGQRLMLASEARTRFERGIDPALTRLALERATQMILEICGGEASEIIEIGSSERPGRMISFSLPRFQQLTGLEKLPMERAEEILTALGCQVCKTSPLCLEVVTPSWRHDLQIPEDLIEEVLRVEGYTQIAETPLPFMHMPAIGMKDYKTSEMHKVLQLLCHRGLTETINWTFSDQEAMERLGTPARVFIQNPISQEHNVMRASLIPNLLLAASKNHARGSKNLGFFEIGYEFQGVTEHQQLLKIAGLRSGGKHAPHWRDKRRPVDVFDVKADVFAVCDVWGLNPENLRLTREVPSYYHPGQAGGLYLGPKIHLGYFGTLHPRMIEAFQLESPVLLFELNVAFFPKEKRKGLGPFAPSPYPAVQRDFAFILDQEVMADQVLRLVKNIDKSLIREVTIFDVYEGPGVPEGTKSCAFSILLQSNTGTLVDSQIKHISETIISEISRHLGGKLRSA